MHVAYVYLIHDISLLLKYLLIFTRKTFAVAVPARVAVGFPIVVVVGTPGVIEILEGHVLERGLTFRLLFAAAK